ncbi:class A beta-lactamase-related serine hydrolase [Sinomicrobium pectinilyticum]|uniref:Class A beta-lactamase-related serine hydrolase n=1 Tax=Sinomicrobium pectinilyticum TaxID=1084421 RepID=A0A3N0EEL8_SINP1|nr:serine hydrolase domain-containing protein [Sinomicrobium pectinilyticum]RNL86295.1 class A beta-lactamase-related serine hydrolase [Sinomicrobium pectinilyticum]
MRNFLFIILYLLLYTGCFAQSSQLNNKQQIEDLLRSFMESIETKDSIKMYSLFADVPITWVGVYQPVTQKARNAANASVNEYKVSDYKTWFRSICENSSSSEFFSNPVIVEDGTIGSVTFDYSFWANGKKGNWGKESWGLIKTNNQWKIASVIFSMESQKIREQPEEISGETEIKHEEIQEYIKASVNDLDFQGTVLVAKGDSIVHMAAYGMYDVENEIPNNLNTQFLIGSLTKSFIAVAIMQLVEQGLLDLTAPVLQYIPNLKYKLGKGVTIHHLLKQQSGLAPSLDPLTNYELMDITPAELLNIINTSKRGFKPGTKYQYSNINYTLLAMVIENVTKLKYQDYLRENIFAVSGMNSTGIERLQNIPENRAVGYRNINGTFRRAYNVVSYAMGSGDIYSTITDLYKWSNALHEGKLISQKSKSTLFDGGNKDWGYYGYGFRVQPYQRATEMKEPGKLIRHGGTMNGFISNYHYYETDKITIIILSNYRNIPIRKMTYEIKEIVLGTFREKRESAFGE